MVFETTIPVFSWFVAKVMGVGLLMFVVPFGAIALLSKSTPEVYFALGFVGLIFFLTYAVMAIVFPNGFTSIITISDDGVSQVASSANKKINRAAIIGGILTKSPGATGAGLLAEAGDGRTLHWREMVLVKVNKRSRYMYFSRGRLGLFPIGFFCPEKQYKKALGLIAKHFPGLKMV